MKRHQGWVGLAAGLALLVAQAGPLPVDAPHDPALDASLQQLIRRAYDRPDEALKALALLQREPANKTHARQLQLAEARMAVEALDFPRALALQASLGAEPGFAHRLALLRAEMAERQGHPEQAAAEAEQAVAGLELLCQADDLRASIARGCDFRALWSALRVLERKHRRQGALPFAEATEKRALALAEAGDDALMSALSMASLAWVSQAMQQPETARRWLVQALQTAQGDPLAMAHVKNFESSLAARRGDRQAQLKALEDGQLFAQQADAVRVLALNRTNLADTLMHLGQPAQAIAAAMQALPVILQLHDLRVERTLRHNLAVAYLQQRRFDKAKSEMARVEELLLSQPDPGQRMRELRELGEAWAEVGQVKQAIALYHEERGLNAQVHARERAASLKQLQLKYDSERKQSELDLLARDNSLKDRQLNNRQLVTQVGLAVAALLLLSLLLITVMVRRVRAANRRLKANEALLRAQSERDPMTELANRRYFLGVMEQQAHASFHGALLMVDIDHFKHVNDEHGHAAGDVVICEVAKRISQAVRQDDLVVRWGGEEFLVFAAELSQPQLAQLAERILVSIAGTPVAAPDGLLRVTASIGFAHFPLPPARLPLHWEQAVNWADMALYEAKAKGRNRAMGIVAVTAADAHDLQQLEADFDAACSSARVSLYEVLGPAA